MITERGAGSSLFERINEAANVSPRRRYRGTLLHSIRDNLRNVLNTRSSSCYGSPELGIADFNADASGSHNIREWMIQAIRNCILCYEPRISDAVVSAAAEDNHAPLDLRFHIVAYMDFSHKQDVLEFDILLDNHQHWCVE